MGLRHPVLLFVTRLNTFIHEGLLYKVFSMHFLLGTDVCLYFKTFV